MIKLTPELQQQIEESDIPIVEITLQDLLQAEKLEDKE
jgi:hypothetical protein